MNILVLGGTQFVGRHIVEALLAGGHTVSIFTRRRTPDELPAAVERLRGDRDAGTGGLATLSGRAWDACVDVSGYLPRQVRPSAELLRSRVGRYVYVSAVSVYGDPQRGPVDEGHSRAPPAADDVIEINNATYGRLKAACEDIVAAVYGDRTTVLRPQIVAGPHDPLDRFSYWVRRAGLGGEMLAPGDGTDHLQVVDARDVGRFTRQAIELDRAGCFNLSGPRLTWGEFMTLLGVCDVVWVPAEVIRSAGVTEFELPLYRPDGGPRSSLMHVSHERASAAGLVLRDLADTVRDTREWLRGRQTPPALSPDLERRLIGLARGAT
jgi:2'-hydroxyisoflavone reductase